MGRLAVVCASFPLAFLAAAAAGTDHRWFGEMSLRGVPRGSCRI